MRVWTRRLSCGGARRDHERRVDLNLDLAAPSEPVTHAVAASHSVGSRARRHRGSSANWVRQAGSKASGHVDLHESDGASNTSCNTAGQTADQIATISTRT